MSTRRGVRRNNYNNRNNRTRSRRNNFKASLKRNTRRVRSRQANIQLDKYKKENEFLNEFYQSQQSVMQQWHHTIRGGQALKAILIARNELRKGNLLTASIFFVLATSIAGIYSPKMGTTTGFDGAESSRLPVANMNTLLEYHYDGMIPEKVRNDTTYKKFIQEELQQELQEEQLQEQQQPHNSICEKGMKFYNDRCVAFGGGRTRRRRRKKKTRKKRGGVTKLTTELPINTPQKIKDLINDYFTDPEKIQLGTLLMALRSKNPRPTEQQIIDTIVNIVEQREHYWQQQQQQGGKKSKKVKEMIKIFQQYPDIFPSGYFRFLGARLENHLNKKTIIFKQGVILTWIEYQKTVKKSEECIYKPGDVKLDQIVNKNPGNGKAKKVMLKFLKKNKNNTVWLEVKKDNKRAIEFYEKNGFQEMCSTKFGDIKGIIMKKIPLK